MVGQGSPKSSHQHESRLRVFARVRVYCALALLTLGVAAPSVADEFRLRMSWGGKARQWYGTISLSSGTLEDPQPLGVEPDEPGSMWLDEGRLVVRQRSPRDYDAVDFLVRAPGDAKLAVQLAACGDQPSDRRIEVPLQAVASGTFGANLDDQGSRLRIERQPGDSLPVHLEGASMVFAPGDMCSFEVDATRLGVASGEKVRFVAQLKNPYAEKPVWQAEVKPVWEAEQTITIGDTATLRWEVPLNVEEGIYQLTITATQPGWLPLPQAVDASLVGSRSRHTNRLLELVVVNPQRPSIPLGTLNDLKSAKVVEEIDPTHPDWWKRFAGLPQLPRLKRLWSGPLGNNRSSTVSHSLGSLVELKPNGGEGDLSWEAYTIPIKEPGKPHVVEVSYPSDRHQTFGVSIVEPNETGASHLANLDTGVDQFEEVVATDEKPQWRQHRVIFWPRTKTPIVLVTNRRDEGPAYYGPIRVRRIGDHLPRAYPMGGPAPARLFAAYMDRPLLPESFSAEEVFVPPSRLGMDDWRTFYQSGTRLVEYLNHVGYGGLFLSVYADGSTIYPSRLLQPTTRYDTGVYLGTGQDPVRKDVLEMLLRLFDREGLKLVPALEFATPLPELEAVLRQGGPETQGMAWVGRDGRSWPQIYRSYQGRAPYYNVLHPRVQEAMLAVVRELVERYAHHRSFAGVAIQLSADGFAQTPARSMDSVWGLDDDTIARFEAAKKIKVAGEGPSRFEERYRQLSSTMERDWLDWKAEEVAAFYRRVHQELTTRSPGVQLYLAGARMFEGEAMQQQLRPALPRQLTLERTMIQVGIDPRRFSDSEGPTLLYGETVRPWTSLAEQSVSLELESMRKAEDLANDFGATGAMFYHQPQETTLPSFDRLSPFETSFTRLTTQALPSESQNRRRFVRALAHFDPVVTVDGGLRMSLGQEDSLRDLITLYRRLPAARFKEIRSEAGSEPLAVRYLQTADATYVLVINEAGFPVSGRIRLQTPSGCRLEEVTGMRPTAPLRADKDGCYWDLELEAYDAMGAWLPSGKVQILGATARWSPEIDRVLEARVSELVSRRFALSRPHEWGGLENPGFEAAVSENGQIQGWMFPRGSEEMVQVDSTQAHGGRSSLRLKSTGEQTSIMSLCFPPPRTGRLAITMWVRSGTSLPAPPLRIGVLGIHQGRTFPRSAMIEGVNEDWSLVGVSVPDMPVEGIKDLRLHVQLSGPGEIWIDDVRLEDLAFGRQEAAALLKTVVPARETLVDRQVTQCIRILESYWPRFLLEYVPPMEQTALAPAQPAPAPAPEPAKEKESSGVLGRLRSLVPERLRF